MIENIRSALNSLRSNKLRTALTMLGISIGVAAVIILVSLGQAVQDYVARQFLGIGSNIVFIFPAGFVPGQSGSVGPAQASNRTTLNFSTLTDKDVEVLRDPFNVPDAKAIVPQLTLRRTAIFEGNQARARIIATTPDYFPVRNRPLAAGRAFDDQDVLTQARVVILGQTTIDALFASGVDPLNESIRIEGVTFKVIGVLQRYGGASFQDEDDFIGMPLTTAQTRLQNIRNLAGQRPISVISIQADNDQAIDSLVLQIKETLRRSRNIDFRDEDDFSVLTQKDLLQSVGQITGLLTIFLAIIASISLLVGGIGIMNIMLVTVTERTREIGLRKAVGARAADVLMQFLMEAIVLALIGGLAGLAVAVLGITVLRVALPDLGANVRLESVILATSISAGIGIFFGLYPANRASRLNPIEALRYE